MARTKQQARENARKQREQDAEKKYIIFSATAKDGETYYGRSGDNLKYTREKRESMARSGDGGAVGVFIRKHGEDKIEWKIEHQTDDLAEAKKLVARCKASMIKVRKSANPTKSFEKQNFNQIQGNPYGSVYRITLKDGRYYIGSTTTHIWRRLNSHLAAARNREDESDKAAYAKKSAFYQAMRENDFLFDHEIVSEHQNEFDLTQAESKMIDESQDDEKCLNSRNGAAVGKFRAEQLKKEVQEQKGDKIFFRASAIAEVANGCIRRAIGHNNLYELRRSGFNIGEHIKSAATMTGIIVHEAATIPPKQRELWIHEDGGAMDRKLDEEISRFNSNWEKFEFDEITPDINSMRVQVDRICAEIDRATDGMFWRNKEDWQFEVQNEMPIQGKLREDLQGLQVFLTGKYDAFNLRTRQIFDIKTSGKYTPAEYGLQLAAYWTLLQEKGYAPSKTAVILFVQRHKYTSRTPQQKPLIIVEYNLTPYIAELWRTLNRAVEHTLEFRTGGLVANPNILPSNTDGWRCSPKWCRLHGTEACNITREGVRRVYTTEGIVGGLDTD